MLGLTSSLRLSPHRAAALSREDGDSGAPGQGAPVIQAAVLAGLRGGQGRPHVQPKQALPRRRQKNKTYLSLSTCTC